MSQSTQAQGQKEKADPVLMAYLAFIDRDMGDNPEHIQPLSTDSLDRARRLVGDLEVDPNEELGADGTLDGSDVEP